MQIPSLALPDARIHLWDAAEMRGKPPKLTPADELELWQCRDKAGVSVARLCAMWGLGRRRMQEILAKQRAIHGIEQMPGKRHLVRARDVQKVAESSEAVERT